MVSGEFASTIWSYALGSNCCAITPVPDTSSIASAIEQTLFLILPLRRSLNRRARRTTLTGRSRCDSAGPPDPQRRAAGINRVEFGRLEWRPEHRAGSHRSWDLNAAPG